MNPSIQAAMRIIEDFGGIDGEHHKTWVIDQIARAPLGDGYEPWLAAYRAGAVRSGAPLWRHRLGRLAMVGRRIKASACSNTLTAR